MSNTKDLYVEDELFIGKIVRESLETRGFEVVMESDGAKVTDLFRRSTPDICVLDVMLPGMNGLDICRELRNRHIITPVLMLTARDAVDDRVAGLDCGADDYLVKPFAFRELLARVRALSRRDSYQKATTLTVGDLLLDTVSHTAKRGDTTIELTTKEYALLEFLMLHPNQVLSRTVIAEHLWSYDYAPDSNVVDVYIRYLRKKIDDDYDEKYIRTIRGTGYQLAHPHHP